ncbi:DUF411 domain-containing protein [Roseibium sp.]|uniref:DUF411 domain-containing protein n=1 Tax=Roseibium sp. TaxID=1936156 RepID=UPI003A97C3F3
MTRTHLFAAAILAGSLFSMPVHAGDENTITVFKSPWCGCCKIWTDAVEKAGYKVIIQDMEDLTAIKKQAGIPDDMEACHTAVMGNGTKYVLEGHVPLEAIDKMMSERPDIRGLAVPGMPSGSLGMGYDKDAKYTVYALGQTVSESPKPYYQAGQ